MHAHGVLFLSMVILWFGGLVSLLLWASWRWAATWAVSAGLTGYVTWLHARLTADMDRSQSVKRRERCVKGMGGSA